MRYCDHRVELVDVHVAISVGVGAYKYGLEPEFNIRLLAIKMRSNELKKI
jgi:hypothetical protein